MVRRSMGVFGYYFLVFGLFRLIFFVGALVNIGFVFDN